MPLLIPTASEKTLADFMLGVTVPGNQILRLYTNAPALADADVAATRTEMAAVLGYVAKTLTKTSWVTSPGAAGQPATSVYAAQTWTFTAGTPVTVYGYFITDATTGLLLWEEAFAAAQVVQNAGDFITITPTITSSTV
jgi:hypothetical protein